MAIIAKTLMTLGVMMFIGAVAWWYVFFEQFLGQDVKDASECFYYTTEICRFGEVAGMVSDIPVYSPVLLWVAAGIFIVGLLLMALTPLRH